MAGGKKQKQKQNIRRLPVFVNKVLHKPIHSCIVHSCFPTLMAELKAWMGTVWPRMLEIFTVGPL